MPWYLYVIIPLAAIALIVAAIVIRTAVLRSKNIYLHRKVTARLKGYARLRGFKVLTNVRLTYKGGEKLVSHVLVGIFGILLVDVHELAGDLYGTADDKKWTYVPKKGKRQQLDSLTLDLQAKAEAVRELLGTHKLYRMTIDSINVVQNGEKRLVLYVPESLPLIRVRKLSAFLNKVKYDTDAGVDMEKIAAILTEGK